MIPDLVIYGTGGMAREVQQFVDDINRETKRYSLIGFLDDDPGMAGREVHHLEVLGGTEWLAANPSASLVLAIGKSHSRSRVAGRLREKYENAYATLIHPAARVGARVQIGEGTVLCPGTVLTTDIEIGRHVMVNVGVTLAHDDVVHDFVTLAPGAHIAGGVEIGEGCDVGVGACTVQGVSLGEWSIVGAGAVVVRDIPSNVTAVGVPAIPIKQRNAGWHNDAS